MYLIGPDGLVNRGFLNFPKKVWMITVHVLRFRIKHQKSSEIITVFRQLPVREHVRALFLKEFRGAHSLVIALRHFVSQTVKSLYILIKATLGPILMININMVPECWIFLFTGESP